jgi:hypothetical protein
LCASLLDFLLVILLVVGGARLGAHLGWYIPIEISVLLTGAAYVLGSEVGIRRTVGKWFCGLTIRGKYGGVPERHRLGLRVLTGKTYDRDLALRLARHDPSGIWGYQEYWDALETVWRVNQSIAASEKN